VNAEEFDMPFRHLIGLLPLSLPIAIACVGAASPPRGRTSALHQSDSDELPGSIVFDTGVTFGVTAASLTSFEATGSLPEQHAIRLEGYSRSSDERTLSMLIPLDEASDVVDGTYDLNDFTSQTSGGSNVRLIAHSGRFYNQEGSIAWTLSGQRLSGTFKMTLASLNHVTMTIEGSFDVPIGLTCIVERTTVADEGVVQVEAADVVVRGGDIGRETAFCSALAQLLNEPP